MSEKLLACPFCGSGAQWIGSVDGDYVECGGCLATMPPHDPDVPNETARWNTRAHLEAGWQPIEQAPKDGTEILGYREDCGVLLIRWTAPAEFLTDAELADWDEDAAHAEGWFYADFLAGGRLEGDETPTHFRYPPAPPSIPHPPAGESDRG